MADADRFTWSGTLAAVARDEFILDRTRVTVTCGLAGLNGAEFKQLLADKYEIQINKTSRNSVLFQLNINNTRGDLANVIQVLADISRDIDERLRAGSEVEREDFQAKVVDLVENTPELPNFSSFHDAFRDDPESPTRHGHIREAYYLAYDADNCEHLRLDDPRARPQAGRRRAGGGCELRHSLSPGFPVIVPGQVVTPEIIAFMRALDVTEIHGYDPCTASSSSGPRFWPARPEPRMAGREFAEVARLPVDPGEASVYAEGWQSWSPTCAYRWDDRQPVAVDARQAALGYRAGHPGPVQHGWQGEGLLAIRTAIHGPVVVVAAPSATDVPSIRALAEGDVLRVLADGPVTIVEHPREQRWKRR